MTDKQDPVISAQVLLKPVSGTMPPDADITASNIRALTPAPEVAAEVTRGFANAGFDVGPVVGLSFAISARRSVFNRFFGIKAAGVKKGALALDRVPTPVRRGVVAITFPEPPDFGPGSYS